MAQAQKTNKSERHFMKRFSILTNDEIWKDILNYEGFYQVSNYGRVKSLNRVVEGRWGKAVISEKILKSRKSKKGYLYVALYLNGKCKNIKIHRLVAMTFIPNTLNLPQVNHKDENKENNKVDNLEWCDNKYNCNYGSHTINYMKAVNQYNMKGDFIKRWKSIKEASRILNINANCISSCCHHRIKTSGKYKWRFDDEINNK